MFLEQFSLNVADAYFNNGIIHIYTVSQKKTTPSIGDYNFDISYPI